MFISFDVYYSLDTHGVDVYIRALVESDIERCLLVASDLSHEREWRNW